MSNHTNKILVVEQDAAQWAAVSTLLPSAFAVEEESLPIALEKVTQHTADFVLLGPNGLQVLAQEIEARTQAHTVELAESVAVLREQVFDTQRIEAEIRRENQELAILNSIPAAVSASLDLTEILLLLKRQLSQQLRVSGGCIYIYDEPGEKFELKETWGFPAEVTQLIATVSADRYPAHEILRTRKPFLVAAIKQDRLYRKLEMDQKRPDWQSCLCVPVLADGAMQGVLVLFSPVLFNDAQIAFYTSFGRQVGAAFHHARLFEQFFAARLRTQVLSQRLVTIQEEERRNLARELHDEIGQILTGLKLILEMSLRLPPKESKAHVQEAQNLVGELMSKVRQISLDLRPGMLDDLGLLPALLWYFERYSAQTKVAVQFTHRGLEGQRFPPDIETAAYRIVQEALTNVARHAQVQTVAVRAWADLDILCVEIEDAGVGFDPEAAIAANVSSGVAGMGERARLLGGGLTIESEGGRGTQVTAHLPLWEGTK